MATDGAYEPLRHLGLADGPAWRWRTLKRLRRYFISAKTGRLTPTLLDSYCHEQKSTMLRLWPQYKFAANYAAEKQVPPPC